VHNQCALDPAKIRKLPPEERVAAVRQAANDLAKSKGWTKDGAIAKKNPGRTVYRDPDGSLWSVDTQHGTLERIDPRTGKHLGEYNFDLKQISPADTSGGHDLRVR
jgi:filamentous hemagglutinin